MKNRSMRNRLTLILGVAIASVFISPKSALAWNPCAVFLEIFSHSKLSPAGESLFDRGYSKNVARKISKKNPDVAKRIIDEDGEKMVVYRGMPLKKRRFDPQRKYDPKTSRDMKADVTGEDPRNFWVTTDLNKAKEYATDDGIVLEYEIPPFMYKRKHASESGRFQVDFLHEEDQSPFISKIGVISPSPLGAPEKNDVTGAIHWAAY